MADDNFARASRWSFISVRTVKYELLARCRRRYGTPTLNRPPRLARTFSRTQMAFALPRLLFTVKTCSMAMGVLVGLGRGRLCPLLSTHALDRRCGSRGNVSCAFGTLRGSYG